MALVAPLNHQSGHYLQLVQSPHYCPSVRLVWEPSEKLSWSCHFSLLFDCSLILLCDISLCFSLAMWHALDRFGLIHDVFQIYKKNNNILTSPFRQFLDFSFTITIDFVVNGQIWSKLCDKLNKIGIHTTWKSDFGFSFSSARNQHSNSKSKGCLL